MSLRDTNEVIIVKEPPTFEKKQICDLHTFTENLWKRMDKKENPIKKDAKPFSNAMIKYANSHSLTYHFILGESKKKITNEEFQKLVASSVANEDEIHNAYKKIIEDSRQEISKFYKGFIDKYDEIINDSGDEVKEAEMRKLSQEKIDEIYDDFYKIIKKMLSKDQDQIQIDLEKMLSDLQDYEDKRIQKSLAEQLKKAVNIYKLREQEAELEIKLVKMTRKLLNTILEEAIKNQKTFKKEQIEVRMEIENIHFDNKRSQNESWFCILCWKKFYDESEKGRSAKNVDF